MRISGDLGRSHVVAVAPLRGPHVIGRGVANNSVVRPGLGNLRDNVINIINHPSLRPSTPTETPAPTPTPPAAEVTPTPTTPTPTPNPVDDFPAFY